MYEGENPTVAYLWFLVGEFIARSDPLLGNLSF